MNPDRHSSPPAVVVVGSINMDLVIRCQRLPGAGETRMATESQELCGGKGANQAVAAARAGGKVHMIGRVGDDSFAARLRQNLADHQIDIAQVRATPQCASGLAIVAVDDGGENSILVVPGANHRLAADDLEQAAGLIAAADVVLVQLEIVTEVAERAISLAGGGSTRVILDPAPAPDRWRESWGRVDLLCPNESEAAALLGCPMATLDDAAEAAAELRRRGPRVVAITLGAQGTMVSTDDRTELVAAYPITAVDSTAAGDAFAGALAVRWAETDDLWEAVAFANAAGRWPRRGGAPKPGIGNRDEIETLRNQP